MWMKWIGAGLAGAAVAFIGAALAARAKKRLASLDACRQTVEQLKTQVSMLFEPPKSALSKLSQHNPVARALCLAQAEQDEALARLGLGKEETDILRALLRDVPSLPAHEGRRFDAARAQLDELHTRLAKRCEQDARLYPKLGLLGGLALFLILL